MKKTIFTAVFLAVAILSITSVKAEGISVSPAVLEYNALPGSDLGSELKITNDTDSAFTVNFELVDITRDTENGTFSTVGAKNKFVKENLGQVVVNAHTTSNVNLTLNLSETVLQNTTSAGILIKFSGDKAGLGINQNMLVPVLAGFTKEVAYDVILGLTTNPQRFVMSKDFSLIGGIVNRQNRNFIPTARMDIRQGAQLIASIPVTEQLPQRLDRDKQADIRVAGANINLQPLQDYQAQLLITDTTTGQIFATTYDFKYVPIELVLLLIAAVMLILGAIGFTFVLKRRAIKKRK